MAQTLNTGIGSTPGADEVLLLITPAVMKKHFPKRDLVELTNRRDRHGGEIDETMLMAVCKEATGIAVSWLQLRYSIPLPDIGVQFQQALEAQCISIARFLLDSSGERVKLRYEAAIEWLKRVAQTDSSSSRDNASSSSQEVGSVDFYVAPSTGVTPEIHLGGQDLSRLFC